MRTSASRSFFRKVLPNIFETKVFLHILLYDKITSKAEAFLCSGGINEFSFSRFKLSELRG